MSPPAVPDVLALLAEGRPLTFETISAAFTPFVPLLARLPDTPQDPQWHAEGSVAAHSALVVAHAHALADEAGLGGEDRAALLLAAALHDLGKARTTREEPDETGALRIRSRQHARRGRDELAFRLLDAGLRRGLLLKVLALVAEHHSLHRALDGDWSRGVPALARRAPLPLLTRLARADARGRVVLSGDAARGKDTADLLELAAQDLGVWAGGDPYAAFRAEVAALLPGASPDLQALAAGRGLQDWEAGRIHTPHEAAARVQEAARHGFPRLTVLCGPSGSGKSTLAAEFPDAEVISLDDLRAQLGGGRHGAKHGAWVGGQVMQAAREALRAGLRRGAHVVWDATSLRRSGRAQVLGLGRDYGALTRIVVAWTPPALAAARNRARPQPVPAAVLADQFRALDFPEVTEAHEVILRGPEEDTWTL
ncbi:AAA family ATPase [Deinococcus multiflagellatus]|uniref:AAA family ATPase n=1 Tax=Deinococcus multiflagellatus TaxID=1656887 RepID=UPI001CCD4A1E|nr:AAA family ATPase [Deinococcus multiflagellatus]MBZ9713349.1 AAA family ATPase [Deinococcus multiflagellatus]